MAELISQAKYAARIGVSRNAVNKMVLDGRITLENGKINPEKADQCRRERCDQAKLKSAPTPVAKVPAKRKAKKPTAAPGPPTAPGSTAAPGTPAAPPADTGDDEQPEQPEQTTMADEKRIGEVLKNKQRTLQIGELEGRLIDRKNTKLQVFSLARQFREHWNNWPARISPIMAAELGVDAKEMQRVLDQFIREHLADMAGDKLKI